MPPAHGSGAAPSETSPLLKKIRSTDVPASAALLVPDGQDGVLVDARGDGDLDGDRDAAAAPETPQSKVKMHWLLPAVGIGIYLVAADQTVIVSCYGKIGSELHALNTTSWIATIYFLTLTSFQPLYGKLSDIFGRKECLLFSYAIFGLGCIFCGLSRNMTELIAARAFAGVGGGGMSTVVSILLSDVVPLRDRGMWQGYVNIIYAAGASSGAPLGGLFVDSFSWRWIFLIQGPFCLLAFVVVYFVLESKEGGDTHWKEKLRQIDFLGAFILVAAVFSLLVGLDRGSNVSWHDRLTISATAVSLPLFALFVFVEMKVAQFPFAPGHIIFERSLMACYLCNLFAFASYMAALFYVPLLFQAVERLNAAQSGARLIPVIAGSVSGSVAAGALMRRTGRYYWLTVFAYSSALVGVFFLLMCTGIMVDSTVGIIVSLIVSSFGCGIGVTTTLIGLISNADPADQAVATACSYLFRSLGSVVGVSLSATVVQQTLRSLLRDALAHGADADKIIENVRQNLDYIDQLEPATARIVRACYKLSTRSAFALTVALMACAVVSSVFIREAQLSK